MPAIKIHIYKGLNNGSASCDFRGENFIGSGQGDEHRTIAEIDPATPEQIALALNYGPTLNGLLDSFIPSEPLAGLLGGEVGLRIGVWDD